MVTMECIVLSRKIKKTRNADEEYQVEINLLLCVGLLLLCVGLLLLAAIGSL